MSINRYNYEEFFLLYADGELNPLEVEMVNQFVQFHPDLKEELDILMDCKLVVDLPISFPKEKLFKPTIWDADNISEIQSNLLLLVDGELEEGFKKELEKNIEENPLLEQEWKTLQRAKLPVETIAHPYKKPLYKVRKVPALAWLRWAAAAAVIGAGWLLIDKSTGGNKIAESAVVVKITSITIEQKKINTNQPSQTEVVDVDKNDDDRKNGAAQENQSNDDKSATTTQVAAKGQSLQNTLNNSTTKENPQTSTSIDLAQNATANDNPIVDNSSDRTSLVSSKVSDNVDDIKVKPAVAKLAPKIGQSASIITNKSSQNITDVQTDDDDEYVRIAGARVKKQKIRGIFRGVFRGIGRTFSDSKVEPAVAINNE